MIYIAHRGLFNGPDPNTENHPNQIIEAISRGFDCEIDLRMIEGDLYLGHDEPSYQITRDFIFDNLSKLWIHAKNIEALNFLTGSAYFNCNTFWHQNDDYTLTSHGFIWAYPGQTLTENCISVMPEWNLDEEGLKNYTPKCYGICSDWVSVIRGW